MLEEGVYSSLNDPAVLAMQCDDSMMQGTSPTPSNAFNGLADSTDVVMNNEEEQKDQAPYESQTEDQWMKTKGTNVADTEFQGDLHFGTVNQKWRDTPSVGDLQEADDYNELKYATVRPKKEQKKNVIFKQGSNEPQDGSKQSDQLSKSQTNRDSQGIKIQAYESAKDKAKIDAVGKGQRYIDEDDVVCKSADMSVIGLNVTKGPDQIKSANKNNEADDQRLDT